MQSSKITDLDQLLYFIGKKLNFRNTQCNFKLTLSARAKLRLELLQAKSLTDPFPGHLRCSMAKLYHFPSFMITLTQMHFGYICTLFKVILHFQLEYIPSISKNLL